MNAHVKKFSENISGILQSDYGDFMRAANTYLNELRRELSGIGETEIQRRLDNMQMYLQFAPNWDDIEGTREKLLLDAKAIDDALAKAVLDVAS